MTDNNSSGNDGLSIFSGDAVPNSTGRRVDTGRLFRSATAPEESGAIPAVDPSQTSTLRSLSPDAAVAVAAVPADTAENPFVSADQASSPAEPVGRHRASHASSSSGGLTLAGIWFVTIGVTLVFALINVFIAHELSWLTGVGVLLATIFCSVTAKRADAIWTIFAAPLVYFLVTITVGQLTLDRTGGLASREGLMIVQSLGRALPFLAGSVVIALIIYLVRRARTR